LALKRELCRRKMSTSDSLAAISVTIADRGLEAPASEESLPRANLSFSLNQWNILPSCCTAAKGPSKHRESVTKTESPRNSRPS
jgi:hypothetical protein